MKSTVVIVSKYFSGNHRYALLLGEVDMHMSFRLLAWNNLKRNVRAYVPYYLSSSLMISIFSYMRYLFFTRMSQMQSQQLM